MNATKRKYTRKAKEPALPAKVVQPPAKKIDGNTLSKLVLRGDLSGLSEQETMEYYLRFCEHLGLDPVTRPFDLLVLNNKKVLYAHKGCTDQLRKMYGVSVTDLRGEILQDCYRVTALGKDHQGRTDAATGVVRVKGLTGDAFANAVMKAETKAKRRLTLSLCGLGMLDESEVETIPGAMTVNLSTGEAGGPPAWTPEMEDQPVTPAPDTRPPGATPTGKPAHTLGDRPTSLILNPTVTPEEREEIKRDYRGKCSTQKQREDVLSGWEKEAREREGTPA